MAEITVAADEVAATELLHDAEATLGQRNLSSTLSLGPYSANLNASGFFTDGIVDLTPPDLIGLENCKLHYDLHFSFTFKPDPTVITFPGFDYDFDSKFPPIHIHIHIHPPPITIYWPQVTIPVNFSGIARFSGNFKLHVYLSGGYWKIDAVNLNITSLQLDNGPIALMAAISLAASGVLAPIPFMSPFFLAIALGALAVAIGTSGTTNFLTNILNYFLTGLIFPLYSQLRIFTVLPANLPLDPEVKIRIDELRALVQRTSEDELVMEAWISPV
jgi:hypothetical protein